MLRFLFRILAPHLPQETLHRIRSVIRGIFLVVGFILCAVAVWLLYPFVVDAISTRSLPDDLGGNFFVGLVMLFIGLVMLVGTRAQARSEARFREALEHDQPWIFRPQWKNNRIEHRQKIPLALLLGGIIFFGVGLFGTVTELPDAIWHADDPEWAALFILIFPLIGLGLLFWAHRMWRKRRTFGRSVLTLDDVPGRLGEPLRARVRAQLDRHQLPDHGIQVQLSCYRKTVRYERRRSGSNNRSSRKKKVNRRLLWRDEKHMRPMDEVDGGIEIPVTFEVPDDQPTSTPIKRSDKYLARTGRGDIQWMVEVHCELPGLDYDASFEVPVFAPVEADSAAVDEEVEEDVDVQPVIPASAFGGGDGAGLSVSSGDPYAEYIVQPDFDSPISENISLTRSGTDALELHVEADRKSPTPYVFGAIGIALLVASVPIYFAGSLGGAFVCLLFGVLCIWGAWTAWTHETKLTIQDGMVTVSKGAFGGKSEEFPVEDFKEARVDITGTKNQSHYRLVLQKHEDTVDEPSGAAGQVFSDMTSMLGEETGGKMKEKVNSLRATAAFIDNLHNKQEADWIAQQIHEVVDAQTR